MEEFKAILKYAYDGDTCKFNHLARPEAEFTSRANWIDCPEIYKGNVIDSFTESQNKWSNEAKKFVQGITFGKQIKFISHGTDQYGRILGDWYITNYVLSNSIQYQLTKNGLAVPFLPHESYKLLPRQLSLYCGLIRAANFAYQVSNGFWLDYKNGNFLLPREFKLKY